MTSPAQSIGELLDPLITAAGLELWDVEINPRALRVLVDRPGGVDLASISELAKQVSTALDAREDLTPGHHYQLEVSSPGVERTLRTPRHYRRFVGTVVAVKTDAPLAGRASGSRRLEGVLSAADDTGITIDTSDGATDLHYDQIQKAHTVLVWGPTAKIRGAGSKATARSQPKKTASARSEPMKDAAR